MISNPTVKPAFNYVLSSDPFEGFKKKSCKGKFPINSKNVVKAKRNKYDNNDKCLYAFTTSDPSTFSTTKSAGKDSNNQEKEASKAAQKKKEKQVALRIAKKEAQQSSTKPMKRPACSGIDHAKSPSSKCLILSRARIYKDFSYQCKFEIYQKTKSDS
ncbi:hypothetical protein G6F43_001374 [Rhizopus delemar]|nr:hypothetical protein G6F43_001374 [Rhizopus delemar]